MDRVRVQTRKPIHPGYILKRHYFIPLIKQGCLRNIDDFSRKLNINVDIIRLLFKGKYDISDDIIAVLSFKLETSMGLWKNLQDKVNKYRNLGYC
jgi:plasmid maintenance system antidote protein VapI